MPLNLRWKRLKIWRNNIRWTRFNGLLLAANGVLLAGNGLLLAGHGFIFGGFILAGDGMYLTHVFRCTFSTFAMRFLV